MDSEKKLSDELIVKAAQKNLENFGVLVERYEKKLKYYILRISNFSELEAEEILQDVFVKAWKNLNGFDDSLKFSSWIYRITHNETISAFRKNKSRGEENRSVLEPEHFENLPDQTNFIDVIDQQITTAQVQTILKTIPESYREVLVLRFIEDKSYEEMSDILMKPGGTIATLLSRAKDQFKQSYQRQFKS
jgi:RNA polymerase sigma-70 factor (ECF subfamily)